MEKWFWIGLLIFGGLLLASSLVPSSRPRRRARFLSDLLLGVTLLSVGLANALPLSRAGRVAFSGLGVLAAAGALILALATVVARDRVWRKGA